VKAGGRVSLEVRELGFRFPGAPSHLWKNLSFQVKEAEVVLIAGGNGSGKSTLLDVLQGRRRAAEGEIRMFGEEVSSWPSWKRTSRWVARGFQEVKAPGRLKAWEVVALGMSDRAGEGLLGTLSPFHSKARRAAIAERRRRAEEALTALGAAEIADAETRTLSGGQRKITEYGLLSLRPSRIYLLDEPLMGLSDHRRTQAARFCRSLLDRGGSLVIVEHGDRSCWLQGTLEIERVLNLSGTARGDRRPC
jgi:ABC-type branched-subunit amino acid transport system ATPase component